MEPEQHKTADEAIVAPNRRRLRIVLAVALGVAVVIAIFGIAERARNERKVVQLTNDQAIPTVKLAKLSYGEGGGTLTLPGQIQPYKKALIYARVSGYLRSWQQDIGAHVSAGQTLGIIDTPDLDQQLRQGQADLVSAEATASLAALTATRWRALLASQSVSVQSADEKTGNAAAQKALAQASLANVRRLQALEKFKTIVAPFTGIVTVRNTDIGALITVGGADKELFVVSDLTKVRVYVQAPQSYTADLRPGLKATLALPQYPGRPFAATVVTTSNALQATSVSMLVELQADNADGALPAGAYCEVSLQLNTDAKRVRIPATALIPVNNGVQVAVVGTDGKVTMTTIQLGRNFGDTVEVLSGILASNRVVDSPPETLESGDPVQVSAPAATPPPALATTGH
jgi:RND family efflux transporter MFP subunit